MEVSETFAGIYGRIPRSERRKEQHKSPEQHTTPASRMPRNDSSEAPLSRLLGHMQGRVALRGRNRAKSHATRSVDLPVSPRSDSCRLRPESRKGNAPGPWAFRRGLGGVAPGALAHRLPCAGGEGSINVSEVPGTQAETPRKSMSDSEHVWVSLNFQNTVKRKIWRIRGIKTIGAVSEPLTDTAPCATLIAGRLPSR